MKISIQAATEPSKFPKLVKRERSLRRVVRQRSSLKEDVLTGVGLGVATAAMVGSPVSALELALMPEPTNALSLPTWIIHVSSVLEWVAAMALIWRYGEVTGNHKWKGMTWGMLPLLGGALCACTWHFFYNNPELEFLVTLQSALTFLGNCTCGLAAYRIYQDAQSTSQS